MSLCCLTNITETRILVLFDPQMYFHLSPQEAVVSHYLHLVDKMRKWRWKRAQKGLVGSGQGFTKFLLLAVHFGGEPIRGLHGATAVTSFHMPHSNKINIMLFSIGNQKSKISIGTSPQGCIYTKSD